MFWMLWDSFCPKIPPFLLEVGFKMLGISRLEVTTLTSVTIDHGAPPCSVDFSLGQHFLQQSSKLNLKM